MPDIRPLGTSGVNNRQVFLSNGSQTLVVPFGRKKLKKLWTATPTSQPDDKYGTSVVDSTYILDIELNQGFGASNGALTLNAGNYTLISETENSFTLQGNYGYFSVMVEY